MNSTLHDADDLRRALEAAGRRFSRQRWSIYECLARADRHPTAEEIYEAVRPAVPNLSLATVYNALEAFVASGLVAKFATGDGSSRFDAKGNDHYHLRCLRSGRIEDVPTRFDPDLIAKLDPDLIARLQERGFHLTGYRLELLGEFRPEG